MNRVILIGKITRISSYDNHVVRIELTTTSARKVDNAWTETPAIRTPSRRASAPTAARPSSATRRGNSSASRTIRRPAPTPGASWSAPS